MHAARKYIDIFNWNWYICISRVQHSIKYLLICSIWEIYVECAVHYFHFPFSEKCVQTIKADKISIIVISLIRQFNHTEPNNNRKKKSIKMFKIVSEYHSKFIYLDHFQKCVPLSVCHRLSSYCGCHCRPSKPLPVVDGLFVPEQSIT